MIHDIKMAHDRHLTHFFDSHLTGKICYICAAWGNQTTWHMQKCDGTCVRKRKTQRSHIANQATPPHDNKTGTRT